MPKLDLVQYTQRLVGYPVRIETKEGVERHGKLTRVRLRTIEGDREYELVEGLVLDADEADPVPMAQVIKLMRDRAVPLQDPRRPAGAPAPAPKASVPAPRASEDDEEAEGEP